MERKYGPIGSVDQHPDEPIRARYGVAYPKMKQIVVHDQARMELARQFGDWRNELYGKMESMLFLMFFGTPGHSQEIVDATIDKIREAHEACKTAIETGQMPTPWEKYR